MKANISPEMTNISNMSIFKTNLTLKDSKLATIAASAGASTTVSSTLIRKGTIATVAAIRVLITTIFVGV